MNREFDQRSPPAAPPTMPGEARETDLLLQFLHDRDHHCPRCGYNLRNLTKPVCPECREELLLKVGLHKLTLHWLLLTLAPGMFCAIALGLFFTMCLIHGPPGPGMPIEAIVTFAFGTISAIVASVLAFRSRWFLRQSDPIQMAWAAVIWMIHVIAFLFLAMNA